MDHSYITSAHFWDFWTPLPRYVSMFLVLRKSKNWHFLTPSPPTNADVIYEWSLTRKANFVAFSEYLNFMTSKHRAIVEKYKGWPQKLLYWSRTLTNVLASFLRVVVFSLKWTEVVLSEMLNEMTPMAEEIPITGKSRFKKPQFVFLKCLI